MDTPLVGMLLVGIVCYCTYLLGRNDRNKIIVTTIDTLIDQGYLRARKDSNGDDELIKWNDR
jgi:hypothetical protein